MGREKIKEWFEENDFYELGIPKTQCLRCIDTFYALGNIIDMGDCVSKIDTEIIRREYYDVFRTLIILFEMMGVDSKEVFNEAYEKIPTFEGEILCGRFVEYECEVEKDDSDV